MTACTGRTMIPQFTGVRPAPAARNRPAALLPAEKDSADDGKGGAGRRYPGVSDTGSDTGAGAA